MRRFSKNRAAILECLRGTKSHPTAEWIYAQLKPSHPDLSPATVYRNLTALQEDGLIRSVGNAGGQMHFDADIRPHTHVVCRICGQVRDVPDTAPLSLSTASAEEATGYRISEVQFFGLCEKCCLAMQDDKEI